MMGAKETERLLSEAREHIRLGLEGLVRDLRKLIAEIKAATEK